MSEADWDATLPTVLAEIHKAVSALGGAISGEHGIGPKRGELLPLVLDETTVSLMRRTKQAFDQQGILNRAKIIRGKRLARGERAVDAVFLSNVVGRESNESAFGLRHGRPLD